MRKSRRSNVFVKYYATIFDIFMFSSISFSKSLSSDCLRFWIFSAVSTLVKRSALKNRKVSHLIRKWISSSTDVQNGQILVVLSKLRCLPFSIISLWLDNRNLLIEILSFLYIPKVGFLSSFVLKNSIRSKFTIFTSDLCECSSVKDIDTCFKDCCFGIISPPIQNTC